jgi:hypothetical protein
VEFFHLKGKALKGGLLPLYGGFPCQSSGAENERKRREFGEEITG